jgi:hypothetical protein
MKNDTVIEIKVDPQLLAAIDMRSKLSGMSRERLTALDVRFANLTYLRRAMDMLDGKDNEDE